MKVRSIQGPYSANKVHSSDFNHLEKSRELHSDSKAKVHANHPPTSKSYTHSQNNSIIRSSMPLKKRNRIVTRVPDNMRESVKNKTERNELYSRRFKHLTLVEENSEYKRFQYVTKSREKVNWKWIREKKEKGKVTKSGVRSLESSHHQG